MKNSAKDSAAVSSEVKAGIMLVLLALWLFWRAGEALLTGHPHFTGVKEERVFGGNILLFGIVNLVFAILFSLAGFILCTAGRRDRQSKRERQELEGELEAKRTEIWGESEDALQASERTTQDTIDAVKAEMKAAPQSSADR